jgi:hypothetical protein
MACSSPRKASTAPVIASAGAPAIAPTVAAAITVRLAAHDPIRLDHGSRLERRPSREQPYARPSFPREVEHNRIIGVHHGPIVLLLVFKDPRFRRDISVNIRMPVEMVGRHVQ